MRQRNWIYSAAAIFLSMACCMSLVSCGDKEKDPLKLAGDGKGPELGWRESSQRVERAPISLTTSDGSGLVLVSLKARTVIEDPLAFTELHLVFNNPEPRRREGRFEITLPQEAAISRFAMRVGDELQEGEVVERRRAQQVYEDFLHRKQDPALLEKSAGNEFSARVFPIEANADKEIVVSYSEELSKRGEPYRLLLQGLPTLRDLDVEVQVGSSSSTGKESSDRARVSSGKLNVKQHDYAPSGDLEVRLPTQKPIALRSGELVVARVSPKLDAKQAPIEGLTVLFDTSASRALGFGAQIERLAAVIAELRERAGKDFELRVVAFDQGSEETYRGAASGFELREQSELLERDALGASDLSQAFAFITRSSLRHDRVLVISDGVLTAGLDDSTALREAVAKLAAHGVRRLDALGEGGIQDRASLAVITRSGLSSTGVVLDSRMPIAMLADKLLAATHERVEVKISNASWVYPSVLEGVQPGDSRIVFAELPADVPLQIELLGAGAEAFETMEVPRPLLARAVARAKIEALSAELNALGPEVAEARAGLQQQIVELSVRERVVSDFTALLVLETAEDYSRFGIAQNALSDILQIGDEGIELLDRKGAPVLHDDKMPMEIARDEEEEEGGWRTERRPEPESGSQAIAPAETAAAAAPPAPASAPMKEEARAANKPGGLDAIGSIGSSGGNQKAGGQGRGMGAADQPEAKQASAQASSRPALRTRSASRGGLESLEGLERSAADGASYRPQPAKPESPLEIAAPLTPKANVQLRTVQGLPSAQVTSVLRGALKARAQRCYAQAHAEPGRVERLVIEMAISDKGTVRDAYVAGGNLDDRASQGCILAAARALRFPKPEGANASVNASLELSVERAAAPDPLDQLRVPTTPRAPRAAKIPTPAIEDAYSGTLAEVLDALKRRDTATALATAKAARAQDPGDVLALVALGEALEATQDFSRAARAYGSIIDLFPSRADLRRMASARLERLPAATDERQALALAVDSYRRAVEQRPDHPSGHRSLAYALHKQGEHAQAFETLERAAERTYAVDRFEGVGRILREDLALIGAAWMRAEPAAQERVRAALAAHGVDPDTSASLRFVLSWETDANDVDFHIYDGRGGHAFYQKPKLASGGALYADITSGYGPECFAISGRGRAYPYVLQAHYFARGPMGFGMGKVQVIDHDGHGVLTLAEHPFVIMKDKAFVELARLAKP